MDSSEIHARTCGAFLSLLDLHRSRVLIDRRGAVSQTTSIPTCIRSPHFDATAASFALASSAAPTSTATTSPSSLSRLQLCRQRASLVEGTRCLYDQIPAGGRKSQEMADTTPKTMREEIERRATTIHHWQSTLRTIGDTMSKRSADSKVRFLSSHYRWPEKLVQLMKSSF